MAEKYSLGIRVSVNNTPKSVRDLQKIQEQLSLLATANQKLAASGPSLQNAFNLNSDELKEALSLIKKLQKQPATTTSPLSGLGNSKELDSLIRSFQKLNQELNSSLDATGTARVLKDITTNARDAEDAANRLRAAFGFNISNADAERLGASLIKIRTDGTEAANAARILQESLNLSDGDVIKLASSLNKVEKEAESTTREVGLLQKALSNISTGIFREIGSRITSAFSGAIDGAIRGTGNAIQETLDDFGALDAALTSFAAKSQLTVDQNELPGLLEDIKKTALEVAAVTSLDPAGVAQLASSLVSVGVAAEDVEGKLRPISLLADSIGENPALTGRILEAGVANFEEFGETTDTLANKFQFLINTTAIGSESGILEFQKLLQQAGPVAATAGVSFDELAAAFAVARKAAISNRVAATGLRNVIQNLNPTTEKAKEALKDLGVSAFDGEGNFVGFENAIQQLGSSLQGLSDEEVLSKTQTIFGREGANVVLALVKDVEGGLSKVRSDLASVPADTLETTLELINASLPKQLELLQGSLDALSTQAGESIAPAFSALLSGALALVNEFVEADVFKPLTESTLAFQEAIKANPQLIEQLTQLLVNIASVLVGTVANAFNTVTRIIEENPEAILGFIDGIQEFFNAASEVGAKVGDLFITLGQVLVNLGIAGADAFVDLSSGIASIIGFVDGLAKVLEFLTSNTELLSAAFQFFFLRALAIQGLTLATTLTNIAGSLIASGTAAAGSAAGYTAFAASVAAAAAPLLVLAGAVAAVTFIKFTKELANFNDDLEAFQSGIDGAANTAFSFANKLKNINEEVAGAGKNATQEQLQRLTQFKNLSEQQIEQLKSLLSEVQQLEPKNDAQRNAKAGAEQQLKTTIDSLQGQVDTATSTLQKAGKEGGKSAGVALGDGLEEGLSDSQDKVESALDDLINANQSALDKIETDTLNAKAALVESGSGQEELAKLESDTLQKRLETNKAFLEELKGVNKSGLDDDELAKLNQQILDTEKQIAQDRVAVAEAANQRIEESFNKLAEANKRTQLERERSIAELETALRQSGENEISIAERVSEEKFKLEQKRIQDEIALEQQKIKKFGANSDQADDSRLKILELENEKANLNLNREKELQGQIQQRQQDEIANIQEALSLDEQRVDIQKQLLAVVEESVQRQSDLIQNQAALLSEIDNARLAVIDRDVQDVNNARDLIAARDSGSLNKEQRRFVNEELADLGFGRNSGIDDVERELLALQKKRQEQEEFSLLRQQELARQTLEIEILRGKAAAERQVIEAEIGVTQVQSAILQAQIDGNFALIPLLEKQLGLRQQQLETAKQLRDQESENAARQRTLLAVQQGSERANLADSQARAARELANDTTDPNVRRQAETRADALEEESVSADITLIAFLNQLETSIQLIDTAEKRLQLEQAITDAINSRNESGSSVGVRASLRKGGPVEAGGLYQVHADEFFVPTQNGTILSQQASRRVVAEALTAGQIQSPNISGPSITTPVITTAPISTSKIEAQLAKLIEVSSNKPPVLAPTTYNLETKSPVKDMQKLDEARIRMLYRGVR